MEPRNNEPELVSFLAFTKIMATVIKIFYSPTRMTGNGNGYFGVRESNYWLTNILI
jgi:hypothetical protein